MNIGQQCHGGFDVRHGNARPGSQRIVPNVDHDSRKIASGCGCHVVWCGGFGLHRRQENREYNDNELHGHHHLLLSYDCRHCYRYQVFYLRLSPGLYPCCCCTLKPRDSPAFVFGWPKTVFSRCVFSLRWGEQQPFDI